MTNINELQTLFLSNKVCQVSGRLFNLQINTDSPILSVLSVLHNLLKTSCTEILAFHSFPPYQHNTDAHHVRRNISFPDSLRTNSSLGPTTYGGISYFLILSVLHNLHKTSCTEILAFHSFPPYQFFAGSHHVRRNFSFSGFLRTPQLTPNKLYGDFGFLLIFSVPALRWRSPRTEEFLFSRFSPYQLITGSHHVRRNFLFPDSLRTPQLT